MPEPDGTALEKLFTVILSRRGADPAESYSAKLLAGGAPAIAKKLGEETVETIIEALKGDLAGCHSIRVNDQWRIVFRWEADGAHEVWFCDYH